MEVLALSPFGNAYSGRRVLVTGHTGFKGSWLCLWLEALGSHVVGLALDPSSEPSHWNLLNLSVEDHRVDIRDEAAVRAVLTAERPEIVFHLAAQPFVRRSYRDPVTTWATNVMGTLHLLEAVRHTPDVRAVVIVTTDKCYENREWPWAYRERDRLGGHDPYSASKAGAELVAASHRTAFLHQPSSALVATARGGNVIGGGDWSEDRLIPDLVRSVTAGEPLTIRSPHSTRPWQHVLDCLSGYLVLGQRLLAGDITCADAWNFGPDGDGNRTVEKVLSAVVRTLPQVRWQLASGTQPHEAGLLQLDSSKAKMQLGWRPVWNLDNAIDHTATWYLRFLETGEVSSIDELAAYVADAGNSGLDWATT
ncbi:CDP-glucose 4,6-dehydratase [Mycobacterium intracellulare]|uniref:CDP-glucose 4,6-dehydratase n=1 Tax=Mycobacterium intracellulare TaxID=1767 RepID=UPI000930B248|nr:CDP-glucose 4,6-dehydratase [Mycobacterium intracellulare]ARV82924.1 CDP-glucose 4,6-dehydratase [Mycobacterium intracellulare subsp. chimaera]ASL10118.1 NAD-dependent epimerase/dehydratase [Mycobacterium intracellulare subsp. chimaera]ASL22019.1 NAD-dependent epimerase/dehydratase [Mycobacterium intracellulare subsp. chimaera]MCA2307836.1 CDP-glucose 4,6-dehydratase [Mycobacterium intracellulare subsp. chimaera]MCA2351114.1 CDP-glucose 4,6-dehydratase [Mycobacterium intracellulare subsp. c